MQERHEHVCPPAAQRERTHGQGRSRARSRPANGSFQNPRPAQAAPAGALAAQRERTQVVGRSLSPAAMPRPLPAGGAAPVAAEREGSRPAQGGGKVRGTLDATALQAGTPPLQVREWPSSSTVLGGNSDLDGASYNFCT